MAYQVNFIYEGDSIPYVPGSDTAAGQVVLVGSAGLVGITKRPIASGTLGTIHPVGVFDFPKSTASSSGQSAGTKMYWDNTNSVATATSSGNTYLGYLLTTTADADTTCRIRMNVN